MQLSFVYHFLLKVWTHSVSLNLSLQKKNALGATYHAPVPSPSIVSSSWFIHELQLGKF